MKNNPKIKENFRQELLKHVNVFSNAVSTSDGDWIVKGFIDIAKNIYTISIDTKVVSKIMELLLFPKICHIAREMECKIVLCKEQNHYPDITFVDKHNNKFAVDMKSTYRKSGTKVNGMTIGAFTGYFRNRTSTKNITFPYDEYVGHFVLGLIYTRTEADDEQKMYQLNELQKITSVIRDFKFFVHEKYKVATDKPGSGNTKNIGSVNDIEKLVNGQGPFTEYGEEFFNNYWTSYLTNDMAKAIELPNPHYKNISEYKNYKKIDN